MKNIISLLIISTISFACFISCDNNFLNSEDQNFYHLEDTIFMTNKTQLTEIPLYINTVGNSQYEVMILPKWMKVENMSGTFQDNQTVLTISAIEHEYFQNTGFYNGFLRLDIKNFGQLDIPVKYGNLGNPQISIDKSDIDFGGSSTRTITIANTNNTGILFWFIDSSPDWLKPSAKQGTVNPNSHNQISLEIDRSNLDLGTYNFSLQIFNNATGVETISITMEVKDYLDPEWVTAIEGDVVDADFCQNNGVISLVTQTPNRLYQFNTSNNQLISMDLQSVPKCISVRENGEKAVIGTSNGKVIYVSLDRNELIRTIDIDCIPFDIVIGNLDWAYIAPTDGQHVKMRSLDLTSEELILAENTNNLYEKTIIRKVTNKDQLIGTRTTIGPSGILLFGVEAGKCNENINYWHETIDNMWSTDQGDRMICGTGKIYNIPDYTNDYVFETNISPVGDIGITYDEKIYSMDHCTKSDKFYLIRGIHNYNNNALKDSWIEAYNAYNYEKNGTFYSSPFTVTVNSSKQTYDTNPHFIFTNETSQFVYVIKNIKPEYNAGFGWSIEKLDLE